MGYNGPPPETKEREEYDQFQKELHQDWIDFLMLAGVIILVILTQ